MASNFRKALSAMGFPSYRAYLYSDLWKARKSAYQKRHPKKCFVCGGKREVHLHHVSYRRIGREADVDLTWLCGRHHRNLHAGKRRLATAHIEMRRRFLAAKKRKRNRRGRFT
jgi:hypothetical protein